MLLSILKVQTFGVEEFSYAEFPFSYVESVIQVGNMFFGFQLVVVNKFGHVGMDKGVECEPISPRSVKVIATHSRIPVAMSTSWHGKLETNRKLYLVYIYVVQ